MASASDVKTLREKTGAGMMDCKKALDAVNGDMDKAIDWLRENGIAKAAKKQSRIAAEGTTEIVEDKDSVIMIEVNSETDFVATNPKFTDAVKEIANALVGSKANTLEEAMQVEINGETVETRMVNLTAEIGEKLTFRRFVRVSKKGVTAGVYSHMGGKIGVITTVEGASEEVAKDVAMHVAAMNPAYLDKDSVPQEDLDHELEVIKEEIKNDPKNASKPDDIIEKMATGKVSKFYKENCLVEQPFIKDDSLSVGDYVKNNGGKVLSMVRFQVGEGIEKKEEDFASEVMSQIK